MRGKTGRFGKPFTKENANFMRLKGLATRRDNSIKRLVRTSCQAEPAKWEMREIRPRVHEQVVIDSPALRAVGATQAQATANLPSGAPGTIVAKMPGQVAAQPEPARNPLASGAQVGKDVSYGYELSPGNWVECGKPPTKHMAEPGTANQVGLLRQRRLLAEAQRRARAQRCLPMNAK